MMTPSRRGWASPPPRQTVGFGYPMSDALPEALSRLDARRVLIVTTKSLAGAGSLAEQVRDAAGETAIGILSGVAAHSPRQDVAKIVEALENADGVITIGGGSVCDAVKVARLCHANGGLSGSSIDQLLDRLLRLMSDGVAAQITPPTMPFVAIPTTLSAGEFTPFGGITDEVRSRKNVYSHPDMAPDMVILDGAMGLSTPPGLWLSTGARAVDHAVETWCALDSTPLSDATSVHALSLLLPALKRSRDQAEDPVARLDCFMGAWLATYGVIAGLDLGASHGIGHALGGTAGMPHGQTSCVMLPHVLRYNASANGERQQALVRALAFGDQPLADVISELFASLSLPRRLSDADVRWDQLAEVATAAMDDKWVHTNPRPIRDKETVMSLLKAAW